jgi:myo-inositol-1(or 4)-monophosphatase
MSSYLTVAIDAATTAGAYQREQFGSVSDYEYKAPGDPLSEIDQESERMIIDRLSAEFPDHAILSEERGVVGEGDARWIVDPLDGTSNFLRGIRDFSVSIALELDGQVHTGVVYRPMSDDVFAATRGGESFAEGVTLGVSDTAALDSALVSVPYSSSNSRHEDVWATHRSLGTHVEGIRSSGSGALDLAYLAAGITDAACGFGQNEWDCAAGLLLVESAGGQITDHRGAPDYDGDFVASNRTLHDDVLTCVETEDD